MIENGALTYGAVNGNLLTWRFTNDVLNEVVIAALLTIISYQAVETVINLCFGIKRRGRAKLRDIQIMLLIRKSSPQAVVKALFPWGRRRKIVPTPEFVDDMSEASTATGRRGFHVLVYAKLLCLLLAIPLINVGSVVLSLERDEDLTFAEGRFGGLAFGFDPNGSISNFSPISQIPQGFCNSTALKTNTAEFPIARFFSCVRELTEGNDARRNNTILVAVHRTPGDVVFVSVTVGSQRIQFEKRTTVLSNKASTPVMDRKGIMYPVKSNLQVSEAKILTKSGFELARKYCDSSDGTGEEIVDEDSVDDFTVSRSGECQRESERSSKEDLASTRTVALDVLDRLSFVNSDEFIVGDEGIGPERVFFPGDELLLVTRRRALVSVPLMAIAALVVVVLRIIAQLATNNDLERGIGLIIRDGLGLPCCDSMLCSSDVVAQYDSRGMILFDVNRGNRD